jgi:hypothetical protein
MDYYKNNIYTVITESWEQLYSGTNYRHALDVFKSFKSSYQLLSQHSNNSPYHVVFNK